MFQDTPNSSFIVSAILDAHTYRKENRSLTIDINELKSYNLLKHKMSHVVGDNAYFIHNAYCMLLKIWFSKYMVSGNVDIFETIDELILNINSVQYGCAGDLLDKKHFKKDTIESIHAAIKTEVDSELDKMYCDGSKILNSLVDFPDSFYILDDFSIYGESIRIDIVKFDKIMIE